MGLATDTDIQQVDSNPRFAQLRLNARSAGPFQGPSITIVPSRLLGLGFGFGIAEPSLKRDHLTAHVLVRTVLAATGPGSA